MPFGSLPSFSAFNEYPRNKMRNQFPNKWNLLPGVDPICFSISREPRGTFFREPALYLHYAVQPTKKTGAGT